MNTIFKWSGLALLLSLAAFKLASIHWYQIREATNSDAESAIRRARTKLCKHKLTNFAKTISGHSFYQHKLKRSCGLDDGESVSRIKKLGCFSIDSYDDISKKTNVILDYKPIVRTDCLETCFAYGHSHGAFIESNSSCICGNESFSNHVNETNCDKLDNISWYQVNSGIWDWSVRNLTYLKLNQSRKYTNVKIAFLLILNGRAVMQVKRLLKSIYSRVHIYYLHVDKRDDYLFNELLPLEKSYSNIIVARRRFVTIWGGPSLLDMIIDSIAYLSKYGWNYMINLSGSDFPIKPLDKLELFLGSNPDKDAIYLKSHNINGYQFIKKQALDKNFFQCENRAWRMGPRTLPRGIIYSGGSDWFVMPRVFMDYITNRREDSDIHLIESLLKVYRYSLLPVESFFHTLALNSKFCDKYRDKNLRIVNWRRKQGCKCQHNKVVDWCGCSPLIYRWSDWGRLKGAMNQDELYFSRKFDPQISMRIINEVERNLQLSQVKSDDQRYWQSIWSIGEPLNKDESALKQFALFTIQQAQQKFEGLKETKLSEFYIQSVDSYFDQDQYQGLVLRFRSASNCLDILVKQRTGIDTMTFYDQCFQGANFRIRAIEVNQGFDAGERMFRHFKPLTSYSDIAVYHEWLAKTQTTEYGSKSSSSMVQNFTEQVRFDWLNPNSVVSLSQNVKLRFSLSSARLSLTHRLSIPKPIDNGLWKLRISRAGIDCLVYRFMVFAGESSKETRIEQSHFDESYLVAGVSQSNNIDTSEPWAITHKDHKLRLLDEYV